MNPQRVLLVRPSALGDIVQCLPALAALRAALPAAEIGWIVEDRNNGVLVGHPHIDRLFTFERRRGGARAMLRVARDARAWRPDVTVDLQGNLKSGMLMRLSGAPRRIALPSADSREPAHLFATEIVPPGPPKEHRADRAMRLVAALGAVPGAAAALPPIREDSAAKIAASLASLGIPYRGYALLVPGTSDFGALKRWPAARFGELALRLREERGLASLVAFGPGQQHLADAVVAASGGGARLAPETGEIHGLLALISGAALVVGADCGPIVISAALGVPTVALFGPKDPVRYAPRGARTTVVWKHVYCSPCTLRRCGDPICMTTMEADEAWRGVESLGALA